MSAPKGLLDQISEIEDSLSFADYHAFIVWYLEQTTYLDKKRILDAICDGSHDKGIDAIVIDDTEHQVNVIQSKFSNDFDGRISESDVKNLGSVRNYFKNRDSIAQVTAHANANVASLLSKAYDLIKAKNFGLNLTFISTKRSPPALAQLFESIGLSRNDTIFDKERVLTLYKNQLKDFNPPLPAYKVQFVTVDHHMIKRMQERNAYVLDVPCREIRDLWLKFRDNLFRKNVRDFLGANRANNGMRHTLEEYPENFWYFNNGITMLCDKADLREEEDYIEVHNPQIVNGCQTTKTIGRFKGDVNGNVLVRIVESRDNEFASRLTLFQNTSNPVKNRDLKSNDIVQVRLKRELARRGYYFEIKRGQEFAKYKSEHRKSWKTEFPYGELSNEDVAKILAAIELGPDIAASKGSETFFDEHYEKLFPEDRSALECLRVYTVEGLIRNTYGSAKWHDIDKAYRFKNRAIWYVIRYVSDRLKGEKNARLIVGASERRVLQERVFLSDFGQIIGGYFELLYRAWKKSKNEDFDSFLTSPQVVKDMKKLFSGMLKQLDRQVVALFEHELSKLEH